ncbi:MAG: 5'/3'-nucleotidase SurE, partial [Bacteroidales bacterium]|nr:5'/3'-nucleotidase SurE [Bacteroidales bacterium]
AIGFSLLDYSHGADFNSVDEYIESIIRKTLTNGLPEGVCLNVNIPAVDKHEINGIKVCKQARGRWEESFDERVDPHHRDYYWLTGVFKDGDTDPDTDSWALANNFISVVPIHFDLTAHRAIKEISSWDFSNSNKKKETEKI